MWCVCWKGNVEWGVKRRGKQYRESVEGENGRRENGPIRCGGRSVDGVIRARKRCESDENGSIRVMLAFCATTW